MGCTLGMLEPASLMSPAIGRVVAEAIVATNKNKEERALLCLERFERNQPVAFDLG